MLTKRKKIGKKNLDYIILQGRPRLPSKFALSEVGVSGM